MRRNWFKILSIPFFVLVLTLGSVELPIHAALLPTTVTVTSASYTSLNVSWNATDTAAGYEVYRATGATGTYTKITDTASLSYLNTGLSFNVIYYYKVQPYFIIDTIKVPGTLSAYGSARTALSPISNLAAVSYAYNAIRTSWDPIVGATGYAVYRSTGTSTSYAYITSVSTPYYVNSYLYTNVKYNYRIRPYRTVNTVKIYGTTSSTVSATTVPSAPANPKVTSTGYNALKVTYSGVLGASGYEVSYGLSETGPFTALPVTSALSVNLTNQSTNVAVYVRIRAYRTVNYVRVYGPYSTVVYGTPIPSTPVVSVKSTNFDTLQLSWPAIAGASGYDLYRFNTATSAYDLIANQTALTYNDVSLTTGITYTYVVKAYRMVDVVKVESTASVAVSGKPIPSSVTNFKVVMPGISFMDLSWSAVTGATGYEILRSSSSTGTYVLVGTITSATTFKNTGLTFNATYYYKIRAYTTINTTKVYSLTSTYISAKAIPSTVTLTVTNLTSKTNALSWPAITGATGYQIYYSTGTSTSYVLLRTQSTTTDPHSALVLNRQYNYKVRAYKMYGTTAVFGAFSTLRSAIVQYSVSELLGLVSAQLATTITKVSNIKEKDILVKIKAAIDARKLDPNYDYIAKANEAKVLFHALSTSEKTHLMLTIIVFVNTDYLLRLSDLLPLE